jgi:SAM-dependent methyltransferase
MFRNTDVDWEKWAQTDPYFGVISDPKFHKSDLSENLGEFWRTGEDQIDGLVRDYERVFGPLARGRALDLGCGVGRLSQPLSRRFANVVGIDVSPSMLAESRKNAESNGITNAEFRPIDAEFADPQSTFDFVVSIFVLQHVPVDRGLVIFEQLLGKIRPGGGCYVQFSISRKVPMLKRSAYWIRDNVPGANQIMNLVVGLPVRQPGMQMNSYPVERIFLILQRAGMHNVSVSLQDYADVFSAAFSAAKPAS